MSPELLRPPDDLRRRSIPIIEFKDRVFRTHSVHRNPVYYGRTAQNRFDAPDQSYGVVYAARDAACAFIETFAWAAGTSVVTSGALHDHALAELKPRRPLRLVDLTQSGALVKLGADARIFAGSHQPAQLWSKALHDHPVRIHGVLYPSRLDPSRHSLALFEDRGPELIELDRQSWYAVGPMRKRLAEILDLYSLELIETRSVSTPRPKPASRVVQHRMFE